MFLVRIALASLLVVVGVQLAAAEPSFQKVKTPESRALILTANQHAPLSQDPVHVLEKLDHCGRLRSCLSITLYRSLSCLFEISYTPSPSRCTHSMCTSGAIGKMFSILFNVIIPANAP